MSELGSCMRPFRASTRRILAPLLLVVVFIAPGCGGGTKTVTETSDGKTKTAASTSTRDCDRLGINSKVGNVGTCDDDGTQFVVVNRGSTLRMHDLNARLVGQETFKRMPDGGDVADGTFVKFTLDITNTGKTPKEFDDQAILGVAGATYTRSKMAEILLDDLFAPTDPVQPGNTSRGSILFDLPDGALAKLKSRKDAANLAILNFEDSGAEDPKQVGVIRLYR